MNKISSLLKIFFSIGLILSTFLTSACSNVTEHNAMVSDQLSVKNIEAIESQQEAFKRNRNL